MNGAEGEEGDDADGGGNSRRRLAFVYMGQERSEIPRDVTHVTVDPSVKVLGDEAFKDCDQLVEVEFCEGLERIGCSAFDGCKALKGMKIPSTVKVIGSAAFSYCVQLVEVVLREGLEQIGERSFWGCRSLRGMKIPSTVKVLGDEAFEDCDKLVEAVLCEGLERIGIRAFNNCQSLKGMKIPSTVKVIDGWTFNGCVQLVEVVLCEGLEQIGEGAFERCKALKGMKTPSTVKVIDSFAFLECEQLVEVVLCEGLEQIEERAFAGCISLKGMKIPSTVKVIDGAFNGCVQLVEVVLCEGLERMDESAFQQCFSLRNVAIPPTAHATECLERCHDLVQLFGSHDKIVHALKSRFDGLPIHKLCYYKSCHSTEEVLEQLKNLIGPTPDQSEASLDTSNETDHNQDCLGMTPLHILACSTKQDLDLYHLIVANYPHSLITKDKWGCLPILYAAWCSASQEIVQFLIESQKSVFPNIVLNWDKMVGTLCRAGTSLDIIERFLQVQKKSFPEHSIDLQKLAQELTIRCLVLCSDSDFEEVPSIWEAMIETLSASRTHQNLIQSLLDLQQNFFPDQTCINCRLVCEEFVVPLKGWWKKTRYPSCDRKNSLLTFQFLVKCCISERLNTIGVKKWRIDIKNTVKEVSSIADADFVALTAHFDIIHLKLVTYEHKYTQLKDATSLLELALWKLKVDELGGEEQTADMKNACQISCGSAIIIRNVLPYLIGDEDEDNGSEEDDGNSDNDVGLFGDDSDMGFDDSDSE